MTRACPWRQAGAIGNSEPVSATSRQGRLRMTTAIVVAVFALLLKGFVSEELRRLPD
jgi:hypothetical protein